MSDDFGVPVSRTLLHSHYVPNDGTDNDALVVSEIIENARGETKPNLRVFRKPKTSYWLTHPSYRDHPDKKEFESLNHLQERVVLNRDKDKEIFKDLNGFWPNYLTPKQRRTCYQSPYLYGANIHIGARAGIQYKKALLAQEKTPHTPTTGFFDIEKSLLPGSDGKLPLMAFVTENKAFLACKKSFMFEPRGKDMIPVTVEEIEQGIQEVIVPLITELFEDNKDLSDAKSKLPFQFQVYAGDTEVDMIRWIFDRMHETQVSFIGIWNLGFDIPNILRILDEEGIPYKDVFAHPSLRNSGLGYAKFREDKRDVQHFTQKWHWMTNTAHFQFVDSMALFSHIRIVDGKKSSYALDDILKEYNLGGKLKVEVGEDLSGLQTADWHRAMLSKYFKAYALYALWDSISLQLLEWINNDITAMLLLSDVTPVEFYVNQTIRVTNDLFEHWMKERHVLGTGVDVEGMADDDLLNLGGAVLEPQNLIAEGLHLFEEWPSHSTRAYAWVSDVDFSALYPTLTYVMNISKQTKLATMTAIKADHVQVRYGVKEAVEVLGSYLITPKANGVEIGHEFFNLPHYIEMKQLFDASEISR